MASQRHKTLINYYPSDCKYGSEGVASPSYRQQGAGPYTVPKGPNGGPLQGSSLAGPAPAGALPTFEHPLAVLGILLSGIQPVNPSLNETSQAISPDPSEPDFTNAPVYPTSVEQPPDVAPMSAMSEPPPPEPTPDPTPPPPETPPEETPPVQGDT